MSEKSELFKKAKKAYFSNKTKELRKLVQELLKLTPLSLPERRDLSNFLNILGNSDQALRILGRILGTHELQTASITQLANQADIASKLVFHSANYTAERIFENVESNLKFEVRPGRVLNKWPFYKGQYLSYTYKTRESLPVLEDAIQFYSGKAEGPEFKFTHLIYLKSLIDSTQYEKALSKAFEYEKVFAKEDQKFLVFLDAIKGEANLALGNTKEAKKIYQLCIAQEEKNKYQPTLATFYRALGDISRLEGDDYQCGEHYLHARRILEKFKSGPVFNWFPLLYSIEALSDVKHTFKHKIFLRLFPTNDPYIRLIEGSSLEEAIPPHLRSHFHPGRGDSWVVHRHQILATQYQNFVKQRHKASQRIIDLVSARIKDQGGHHYSSLSLKQARCLRALLGSGHVGVKHFHLLDYVYRQNFVDLESGQARLNKLIAHLRSMGFPIKLMKTRYFLEPDYNDIYICLKNNRDASPLNGLSTFQQFRRQDMDDFFGLKRSRSGKLIADWLEVGVLEKVSDVEYRVKS